IGTICSNSSKNLFFDIFPINENGEHHYNSANNRHLIKKRSTDNVNKNEVIDYIISNKTLEALRNSSKANKMSTRVGTNGEPLYLFVELLVVTDSTVFQYHKNFMGSSDQNLIFSQMRIYYAHLINGINQRFTNSLVTDPDLRIFIVLKNFLFLTNAQDLTWLNINNVGEPGYPTYENKEVVLTGKTLNAFTTFMNSKNFEFTYDHAVALFNKDLWSDDPSQSPSSRSGVAGFASVGQICTSDRYSLSEDFGGFSNSITIAHEIGHNLGAIHDGEAGCFASDNYIMTPILNAQPPQTNFYKFSSCSISQFKATLLNAQLNGAKSNAQCLTNTPSSFPIESSLADISLPGLIWNANDQCRMQFGPQSSSVPTSVIPNSDKCDLFCYQRTDTYFSLKANGGAIDGTPCDVGKICIKGVCTSDNRGPTDSCVNGDTILTGNVLGIAINSFQISCSDLFKEILSKNLPITSFCSDKYVGTYCCQSCKKYNALTCFDEYPYCSSYSNTCDTTFLNGAPIWMKCKLTCKRCQAEPLRCTNSTFLCYNGGTCRNTQVEPTSQFGFECVCPRGFTGELCELSNITLRGNPCFPNPCLNNGGCNVKSSTTYSCSCPSNCFGLNCESCIEQATTTTRIPTTTSTTTRVPTTTTTTSITTTTTTTTRVPTTTTTTSITTTTTTTTTRIPTTTSTTATTPRSSTTTFTTTIFSISSTLRTSTRQILDNCKNIDEFFCLTSTALLRTSCNNPSVFKFEYPLSVYCCVSCQKVFRNCVDSSYNCKFLANRCNELSIYKPHPCPSTCNLC
ncbi:unnamed protein product, partial [Brachionus calyciflorus]